MLEPFETLNLFPATGPTIIENILVALVCGLVINLVYRHTYRGPGYSLAFVNSLPLLAMITSLVIMVIGNDLARAFGLVGAMSIIRFRTPIKDPQDIVYIFFALAIGLAAGAGFHKIAIVGTVAIGGTLVLLSRTRMATPRKEDYLLQFLFSPNGSGSPDYPRVIQRHCRRHDLLNVKTISDGLDDLEISYFVKLKDREGTGEFIRELRGAPGIRRVNLFFDEEQF
jgi:uncharacterized membrane protein YhiD involved in acid resistance